MDPSESFFGWDLDEVGLDYLDRLNMSPFNFSSVGNADPTSASVPEVTEARDLTSAPPSELIRDAQPRDTPWVRYCAKLLAYNCGC